MIIRRAIAAVAVGLLALIAGCSAKQLTPAETVEAYVQAAESGNYTLADQYVCATGSHWLSNFEHDYVSGYTEDGKPESYQVVSVDDGPHNPQNGNIWTKLVVGSYSGSWGYPFSIQMGQTPGGTWLFCDRAPTAADDH